MPHLLISRKGPVRMRKREPPFLHKKKGSLLTVPQFGQVVTGMYFSINFGR